MNNETVWLLAEAIDPGAFVRHDSGFLKDTSFKGQSRRGLAENAARLASEALEQTPEMKALREPNIAVLHAKCLELLKTLGHENGCAKDYCALVDKDGDRCNLSRSYSFHLPNCKYISLAHDFVPLPCNCAHSKLAALLGRTVG